MSACGDDGSGSSSGSSTASSASASASSGPVVVATTSIWADVTSRVACDAIEVSPLVPLGADAHEYEPTVQDADQLRSAELVVANGLGLEEGSLDLIDNAGTDGVTVLELGEQLDPLEAGADGDHSHDEEHSADEDHSADEEHSADEDHSHGEEDPHVWMDPDRVAMAVPLIAEGLKGVDELGIDEAQIDACADDYVAELSALAVELDEQFAGLDPSQRQLVTNHEALGYFADRFDFEVIGAIVPSTSSLGEANVRDLEDLAALMEERGVSRIYGEVTGSDEVATALAERVGAQVEIVELFTESLGDDGSGAATYLEMMRTNGDLIAGK